MKILLSTLFDNIVPFQTFYDHFCMWLVNHMQDSVDVKFLISFDLYQSAFDSHLVDKYNPILVSQEDIKYVFNMEDLQSLKSVNSQIRYNNLSAEEKERLKILIKQKISDWEPDIILSIGHINGANLYHHIFPNALCLSTDNAIFSRPPFNRTLSYDPYTAVPYTFLSQFADNIKSFQISENENALVERFKKSFMGIIDKYSPLDDTMIFYYKQKFDKLVLLPLVSDFIVKLFGDCIYDNEFDLVEDVMQKTPKNIGVFVTQHDSCGSLTPENIKYFKSKYPNFIFLQQTNVRGYASSSLNYFKYVDAVLNTTSKTGFMALIYDKPVISLARQYNKWYADGDGIETLESVLNSPYKNKNNILYWYFTRYVIFYEDFGRQDFLYNFINGLLERYRNNGIDFNFYQPINDFDKIFDYVIGAMISFYQRKSEIIPKQILDLQNNVKKCESEITELKTNIGSLPKSVADALLLEKQNLLSQEIDGLKKQISDIVNNCNDLDNKIVNAEKNIQHVHDFCISVQNQMIIKTDYLQKHSSHYNIVRLMSHITFGKMGKHFKSMKKSMLS